jgi:hypothetical protein
LVQRAKKNLPEDLTADGLIQGRLTWQDDAAAPSKFRFEGRGEISDFRLASASNKTEIGPVTVPFVLRAATDTKKPAHRNTVVMAIPEGPHLEFGPFPVAMGRTVAARGWVGPSGYSIALSGDAEISKALRLARMVGLPALQTAAEGTTTVDLRITGSWDGWSYGSGPSFLGPRLTGTAKLHNVRVAFRGAGGPVEISSGEVQLLPNAVRVEKLNARVANTQWMGSLELPRGCGTPDACLAQFNLNANEISVRELSNWINPSPAERPWYRVLDSSAQTQPSLLVSLYATGRITADRFQMQRVAATHFVANLRLDHGNIQLSDLHADMLGGKLAGEWRADASIKPTNCTGSGKLTGISLSHLADAMKDENFSGTANAAYEVKGPCETEFWPVAVGSVRFDASNTILPRFSLADNSDPLRITQLAGQAKLQAGQFVIEEAKVDSDSGKFQLSGTAALNSELELKLTRAANATGPIFSIAGTLAQPQIKLLPGLEQARLKTEPAK